MSAMTVFLKIDEERMVPALQEAVQSLDSTEGRAVLDLSSVHRIDPGALDALKDLVRVADDKNIEIALRGVNVDLYRVLKLLELAQRFSFLN